MKYCCKDWVKNEEEGLVYYDSLDKSYSIYCEWALEKTIRYCPFCGQKLKVRVK